MSLKHCIKHGFSLMSQRSALEECAEYKYLDKNADKTNKKNLFYSKRSRMRNCFDLFAKLSLLSKA